MCFINQPLLNKGCSLFERHRIERATAWHAFEIHLFNGLYEWIEINLEVRQFSALEISKTSPSEHMKLVFHKGFYVYDCIIANEGCTRY